jgi:hypothetical protein
MREISCPPDCVYLAGAEAHPPAFVRKQRQRDLDFAMPMVHKLSDQAYRLLIAFQELVRRHNQTALPALVDTDIAEAARALAATLETAAKGIIFEHRPQSLPAQRLLGDLRSLLAGLSRSPSSALERDAAVALRRIEEAALRAGKDLDGGPTAYVEFLRRLPDLTSPPGLGPGGEGQNETSPDSDTGSRLILP